jgi:hypothetical protein
MNITNIKATYLSPRYQRWEFESEGLWYRYRTNETPFVRGTEVIVLGETTIHQFYPDNWANKGPNLFISEFLPLDPENPIAGIEKFYKLIMLQ